uniref:Uncharacterized protein n=1 Tax=Anguilla anguilla TaxID=7936 RepID=A0A0E9SWA1_ANGAN
MEKPKWFTSVHMEKTCIQGTGIW